MADDDDDVHAWLETLSAVRGNDGLVHLVVDDVDNTDLKDSGSGVLACLRFFDYDHPSRHPSRNPQFRHVTLTTEAPTCLLCVGWRPHGH